MFREIGGIMLTFGLLSVLAGIWGARQYNWFVAQLIIGPIFIYFGLQLLK